MIMKLSPKSCSPFFIMQLQLSEPLTIRKALNLSEGVTELYACVIQN